MARRYFAEGGPAIPESVRRRRVSNAATAGLRIFDRSFLNRRDSLGLADEGLLPASKIASKVLASLHKRLPRWRKYARARNGSATSQGRDGERNPPGGPRVPRPRQPSPEGRKSTPAMTRPASPVGPHHCPVRPLLARRNRTLPAGGWDAFRKTDAIALATPPAKAVRDRSPWPDASRKIPP